MDTLTPNDFGETQSFEALITGVYYGTVEATDETDDVPSNVFFSLLLKTPGGLQPVERAQSVSPVPADGDLNWGAYPSRYVGKVVPVLRAGNRIYPVIPWMPATIDCEGQA